MKLIEWIKESIIEEIEKPWTKIDTIGLIVSGVSSVVASIITVLLCTK